ncbi:MAG: hypothetical protein ABR608_02920, partial [Pseudonocardiaceae bacterium]
MSTAVECVDPHDDGLSLDPEDHKSAGPSVGFRRAEAAYWLGIVFADRVGYVAMAYGAAPYRTAQGAYRHRTWREQRYLWPAERDQLLGDVAEHLAGAVTGGPHIDAYICPHLRRSDGRDAHTTMKRAGNVLPLVAVHADLDGPPADPELWATLCPLRVASGTPGHEHGLVLLAEPCEDLDRWCQLQVALRDRLGGGADSKIADNDVLRLPGTVNCKPAAPRAGQPAGDPAPVTVLPGWGGRLWTVPELAELLGIDLTHPAPPARPTPTGGSTTPVGVGRAGGAGWVRSMP